MVNFLSTRLVCLGSLENVIYVCVGGGRVELFLESVVYVGPPSN